MILISFHSLAKDHDKMGLEKLKEEDESVAHVKFQMRKFLALTDLRNFPVPGEWYLERLIFPHESG